jgi:hypothetical protein
MAKKRIFAFEKAEQMMRTGKVVRLVESSMEPRPKKGRRARPGGIGLGVSYVAITEAVTGATWDGSEATDSEATVYPFSGGTISEDNSTTVIVGLAVDTTITTGKFKRAIVIGGHLVQIQCTEWDLPDGWGE